MDYDALVERWNAFDVPTNIYRVDPAVEPLDDVYELTARAGLTRMAERMAVQRWNEIGPLLEMEDEPHVFTVYRPSRALQYVDSSRWQVDDGVSAMEVSDEEAIDAAVREVDRLRLADRDTFEPGKVTRLNVASAEKGRPIETRVIDVGVVLTRVIDGLQVEGQGGSIVMYLDADMQPTGFERIARRIADVHAPVQDRRSLDDVLAEVEAYWRTTRDRGLTVVDARLCYVELGRLEEQEYIQPAYALSLRLSNQDNGETRTVEHYAPAAANAIGTLMPRDTGPSPEPRSE